MDFMTRHIPRFFLMALFVTACTEATVLPTETSLPPTPLPTSSPTLLLETEIPQPFTTTTPVIVIENPNVTPTATPAPLPISIPKEKIAILRPAAGSNITSPFRVNGYAGPSWNNRVELRLIGEDGRLISSSIGYILALPGNSGPFTLEMEFDTNMIAEMARLEVRTFSTEDTKMDHMASVDLILLSIGAPLVHWTIHGPEQITILSPQQYDTVRNGITIVKGVGWVNDDSPLHLEVLDHDGNVVGTSLVQIDANSPGMAGTFESQIQFQIDEAQLGRIVLYEASQTIPGMTHYASVIVQLRP
jgi:hypothetical protein